MENASKALLIAGAILLVIAIIAIGMVILNQSQDVVNQTGGQINALAINAHNQQFGSISNGEEVSGSRMKEIATQALSNNKQAKSNKVSDVTVTIGTTTVTNSNLGNIALRESYTITSVTYNDSGAITGITATGTFVSASASE